VKGKYWGNFIGGAPRIYPGSTGNCLKMESGAKYQTPQLTNNETTIVGFAFKLQEVLTGDFIFQMKFPDNNGYVVGHEALSIRTATSNELELKYFNSVKATSSGANIHPGEWNYLEIKVTSYNGTDADFEMRINENTVMTYNGDLNRDEYHVYSSIILGVAYSETVYYDDLYICDGTGNTNNDFLGTINIKTIGPSSDISNNWNQSTGNDAYSLVNEIDQTSNHIYSNNSGDKVNFEMDDISTSDEVKGVVLFADSKITGNLNKYAKLNTQNGASGNLVLTGNIVPGIDNVLTTHVPMDKDPDGNDWTPETVNTLRVGLEVS
jgi:hypothetical protein